MLESAAIPGNRVLADLVIAADAVNPGQKLIRAIRRKLAEISRVHQKRRAELGAAAEQSRRAGNANHAGVAEIQILVALDLLIKRREPVQYVQHRSELHIAHAIVFAAGASIERSVADREIKVPGGVRRQPFAGLPDPAVAAVRGGAEDRRRGEVRTTIVLVGKDLSVVGKAV